MDIVTCVERLTGQPIPFAEAADSVREMVRNQPLFRHSQFNELLLMLGYDRISDSFFSWLFNCEGDSSGVSFDRIETAVLHFEISALRLFGNVKFAFKELSFLSKATLDAKLESLKPIDKSVYESRPEPLDPIEKIDLNKTIYLGHYCQDEIRRAAEERGDNAAKETLAEMEATIKVGQGNYRRYMTDDYMDVYVATSMRQRHEFFLVGQFVNTLFGHDSIRPLALRYFDPTQAFCLDRIDKGLVEALMLKRSSCTIYLVQENDTFGKDSELAATLAQGKPVIAYVPELKCETTFIKEADAVMDMCYRGDSKTDLVLQQLQVFYPDGAWKDHDVRSWAADPTSMNEDVAKKLLFRKAKERYDRRAEDLRSRHPLGLQVNLETGVANGVLVVRSVNQCAELLRAIVLNQMELELDRGDNGHLSLVERVSKSVFRVQTADKYLTNSFWNFYL